MSSFLKTSILFIIVLLIACFFRLYLLPEFPSGLYPDQAANGLDALLILDGHHAPFFERGNGREALFFYFQALLIKILGVRVFPIFLASAIVGILTVVGGFFLVKVVLGNKAAFFASFMIATSFWHTTLSRTGFRAILLPLFATFFFLFFFLTLKEKNKKKKYLYAVLTGIFFGGGFYTYLAFRVMVGIAGAVIFAVFIANLRKPSEKFEWFKKYWLAGIVAIFIVLIVLTPLLIYFAKHPEFIAYRAGHVSIFNPDLNKGDVVGTFFDVIKKTAFSYFTYGDLNWRHNVSGFAFLNPFVASFFGLGFVLILFRLLKGKFYFFKNREKFAQFLNLKDLFYFTLLFWFLMMLVPEVLTAEGIPHSLRLSGTIPSVFIIATIGIIFLADKIRNIIKTKIVLFVIALMGLILLIESAFYDYTLYFKISGESNKFYYAYRSDLTPVSNYLNDRNNKEKTYLVLDEFSVQTPEFLTAAFKNPYKLLDPAISYQVILKKGDQIVFTQSTIFDTIKFGKYHPEAKLIREDKNKWDEVIMRIYEY